MQTYLIAGLIVLIEIVLGFGYMGWGRCFILETSVGRQKAVQAIGVISES